MKSKLIVLFLITFSFANAQINVVEGFDSGTPPAGWIYNIYQISTNASSSGNSSLRANYATTAGASITTPNYVSNGMPISFGFRARTLTPAISHLNYVKYSINNGPWEDYINFSANNQNPWQLYNFPIIAAGVVPSGSTVKFQIVTFRTAASGLIDVYFDSISIQQGLLPMSTVAEYNFDNTYTNVNGSTPFTSNSSTSFVADRHGNATGAVNLDFTAMQATIPFLPISNSARSVSLWIKSPTAVVSDNIVFSYGTNNTDNSYGLSFGTNFIRNFGFNNDLENPFVLTTDDWKHVVCTYNATGTATIYIDGVSLISDSKPTWNTNNSVFRLGFTENSNPSTFSIDDLKIYNYALSQTEVTNLFTNNTLTSENFNASNVDVKLYPNPAQNVLNIETTVEIKTIEMFTIHGQKVLETNQNQIDVSILTSGMYLVKIQDIHNQTTTKKVIIK